MRAKSSLLQRRDTARGCGRALWQLALCAIAACTGGAEPTIDKDEIGSVASALTIEPVSGPSYLGTVAGANCGSHLYEGTLGHRPTAPKAGGYPLFLYFVGTGDSPDQDAAELITQAMAERGFVALAVDYDNQGILNLTVDKILAKAACLYAPNGVQSLVRAACADDHTNCGAGIVTWGASQGAVIAALAASYDARVRASWATSFGQFLNSRAWAITLMLPHERLRLVNGESDGSANVPSILNEITGRSCNPPAGDVSANCFTGPGGAGWYIIDNDELADNPAHHCWFYKNDCIDTPTHIEPNWATGNFPFSIGPSADWLMQASATPTGPRQLSFNFAGLEGTFPLTGQYPAGTVDWGSATPAPGTKNFHVAFGAPGHGFLGEFWSDAEATGRFTLWGVQGRTLTSITVKNTATTSCKLTTRITRSNGVTDAPVETTIAAGATQTISYNAANAKLVELTSSKGALLQFHQFVIGGSAEVAVP